MGRRRTWVRAGIDGSAGGFRLGLRSRRVLPRVGAGGRVLTMVDLVAGLHRARPHVGRDQVMLGVAVLVARPVIHLAVTHPRRPTVRGTTGRRE